MTIPTKKALRDVLRRRAVSGKKTILDVVQETLEEGLVERRMAPRAARLLGGLLRAPGETNPRKRRRKRRGQGG